MKPFKEFIVEGGINAYTHADSTSGGCPLNDLLFDRINRAMFEENTPFWILCRKTKTDTMSEMWLDNG